MSSSVIGEDEKEAAKGILEAATEVKESRVASPSASKPCTYFQKSNLRYHKQPQPTD